MWPFGRKKKAEQVWIKTASQQSSLDKDRKRHEEFMEWSDRQHQHHRDTVRRFDEQTRKNSEQARRSNEQARSTFDAFLKRTRDINKRITDQMRRK